MLKIMVSGADGDAQDHLEGILQVVDIGGHACDES